MAYTNIFKLLSVKTSSAFAGNRAKSLLNLGKKGVNKLHNVGVKAWGRPVMTGMAFGAAGFGTSLFRNINSLRRTHQREPRNISAGEGYITWSKKNGMPANHLSTQGLGLSLNKLRHTSLL